jgi:hypothetical protein
LDSEADILNKIIRKVSRWLTTLAREDLDSHTLGVIHACLHAMGESNPRLALIRSNSQELEQHATILANHVHGDGAELYYALILQRAAEIIVQRRQEEQHGGMRGPGLEKYTRKQV